MADPEVIRQSALETLQIEQEAIAGLSAYIDSDFISAVMAVHQSTGRLVISGIGKSAIIAQKIVATLNSTGTPALFLHAADAIHGDLGMLQPEDVALVISKSGESEEIKVLVPLIRNFGNTLIALCGNTDSFLYRHADHRINCTVSTEACPNNLAPTSSTTAQLVMGDALAVCLLKLMGFRPEDFARFHPGGALGKRLYLKAGDLSRRHEKPVVAPDTAIPAVIMEMTGKRLGATAVVQDQALLGMITDGDIRRMIEKYPDWTSLQASDIMNPAPKSIEASALAVHALTLMRTHNISQLIVTEQGQYVGMVHIHDLLREGII